MSPHTAVIELIAAGWSEARIALKVGASQPTIHRLKHGTQRRGVSFDVGQKLLELHQCEVRKDNEDAPQSGERAA